MVISLLLRIPRILHRGMRRLSLLLHVLIDVLLARKVVVVHARRLRGPVYDASFGCRGPGLGHGHRVLL